MLADAIQAYYANPITSNLTAITTTTSLLQAQLNTGEIWKIFIKNSINCTNQQLIISLAVKLSPFFDLAISNLADYVSLSPSLIFESCYRIHLQTPLLTERVLRALTDCKTPPQQCKIELFALTFSDFAPLANYIKTASKHIFSDFSEFFQRLLSSQLDSFSQSIQSLQRSFLVEIRNSIDQFGLLTTFSQQLARKLIDCSTLVSVANSSEIANFDVFSPFSPIRALEITTDAGPAIDFLMRNSQVQQAVRLAQNVKFDVKEAISCSLKRLRKDCLLDEISLFAGVEGVDAVRYLQQLNNSVIVGENVILKMNGEGKCNCAAGELEIQFERFERFKCDLMRSSAEIEIFGVKMRMQGVLLMVLGGVIEGNQVGGEFYQDGVESLIQYGILEEVDGEVQVCQDTDVYEVYAGEYLEITVCMRENQKEVNVEILKGQIVKQIKQQKMSFLQLERQFGKGIKGILDELAENEIITVDDSGMWCFD